MRKFLRNFMRFYLRKWVSCGIICRYCCGLSAGTFALASSSFSVGNSAGKFPADFKNRSKQLPTKVLAGNQNPFPADFWSNSAGKSAGKMEISSSVKLCIDIYTVIKRDNYFRT
ncbi:hypothetical protein P8452_66719 [Trifolium repens]|nr:hypothetical protein P8452_66719 [Trifolium repens]